MYTKSVWKPSSQRGAPGAGASAGDDTTTAASRKAARIRDIASMVPGWGKMTGLPLSKRCAGMIVVMPPSGWKLVVPA